MVTYCVTKLTPTCSLMTGKMFDTRVVIMTHQNIRLGNPFGPPLLTTQRKSKLAFSMCSVLYFVSFFINDVYLWTEDKWKGRVSYKLASNSPRINTLLLNVSKYYKGGIINEIAFHLKLFSLCGPYFGMRYLTLLPLYHTHCNMEKTELTLN